MKTAEIRTQFLNYFKDNKHTVVPSSSLVPGNDPTLLFTNAGMVQFKDVFLGTEKLSYKKATSSQKCVRAGGKHNDLENVGYTARHHTFFEMLGNFSFGDYFKKEAIEYAWEFITKVLKLPEEKLWVTVYKDDKESEEIWLKHIKVSKDRFVKCGEKDNFWSMGDTGPCGPCTEIFYDHGKNVAGGPPGSPDEHGDRYVEIWNLVFMQYNRDKTGKLSDLPKPSVDTGMGLERIAAVMQNVNSNYDIDLFKNLISFAAKTIDTKDLSNTSLKVVVDHLRSCSFLVADGIFPSNEGRGYVLRRIMRRAIRHGRKLGATKPFFYKLVKALCTEMGDAFPDLKQKQSHIEQVFLKEENQFGKTLEQGLKLLDSAKEDLKDKTLPGDVAFKLYDTYGFPVDLTADLLREQGMEVDMHGFEQAMLTQRERARKASGFKMDAEQNIDSKVSSKFVGYDHLECNAVIKEIYIPDTKEGYKSIHILDGVDKKYGDNIYLVLDKTPFYAESGGQVGDEGVIETPNLENSNVPSNKFKVTDVQKQGNTILHIGRLISGILHVDQNVKAKVDKEKRLATVRNHSATHLLHAALRKVLGAHVIQKGSVVDPIRTRFDFSHGAPLTEQEIFEIERLVNEEIMKNTEIKKELMPIEKAREKGAMALFGEKYDKEVRVLTMGDDFSIELCGGTHANRTGDIGMLKIVSETGVAAGVRRVEATTGHTVHDIMVKQQDIISKIAGDFKTDSNNILDKIKQQTNKIKDLEKEIKKLKASIASGGAQDFLADVKDISNTKVLATLIPHADANTLRETMDNFKSKLKTAVIVLATENEGKLSIVAGVTKDKINQVKAGELVNFVAEQVGGKGGGRPDMAMAGGNDSKNLQSALESVYKWVEEKLS